MKLSSPSRVHSISIAPPANFAAGSLNIVAIYDGLIGGVRVAETLDWLRRSFTPMFAIGHRSWSFAMLERLDVRAASVWEMADADLLLVGATGGERLPLHVTSWIDRCFRYNGSGPRALIALHEDDSESEASPTTDLEHVASRWQMDFVGNRQVEDRFNSGPIDQKVRRTERDSLASLGYTARTFGAAYGRWGD